MPPHPPPFPFWPSDLFSEIADWVALAGFALAALSAALTVYLTATVNRFKAQRRRQEILPEQQRRMLVHCEQLVVLLEDYAASRVAIQGEVGSLVGTLRALKENLHKQDAAHVDEVLALVKAFRQGPTAQGLGEIYSQMMSLSSQLAYTVQGLDLE